MSHNQLILTDFELGLLSKPKDQWEIKYRPVKYEFNQTVNSTQRVFNSLFNLDSKKSETNLTLLIQDGAQKFRITTQPFDLLQKHEQFTKNQMSCQNMKGSISRPNYCTTFKQLTKVCLLIDKISHSQAEKSRNNKEQTHLTYFDGFTNFTEKLEILQKNKSVGVSDDQAAWQFTDVCGMEYD